MSLPFAALSTLAWRNLWRNRRRTLIMLAAIVIGIWAMIFMNALARGMVDQMLGDGIRALPGQVQIHHPDYRDDPSISNSISAPGSALEQALERPPVVAWTARVRVPSMISSERESRGVTLVGVDPAGEVAVGFDPALIVEGRYLESAEDSGLVIGRKMAQRLETRLGKRVAVMSQDPNNEVADRGFRIVGIFKGQLETQEEGFIYAGRQTVQAMLNMGSQISELAVNGDDYRVTEPLVSHLRAAADSNLEILPWHELDGYLGTMVGFMDGFILVFVLVIFLVLSFGLVNTLMMAVFERVREIGLMQALGMRPSAIIYLILIESILLLLVGQVVGTLLAVGTLVPLLDGIDISAVGQGMEMMGAASVLYPTLTTDDVVAANVVVLILGLVTSLLPAWRGSRYRPVEAIAKT